VSTSEREHPRYAHEAAVTLHVGKKSYEGHTRNVSRGGLCADLTDAVAMGTDVVVDLVLVFDGDAQSEPLRLPARVVWCTTVDNGHQVGVSFKPLTAEQMQMVSLFLRYLDDSRGESEPAEQSLDDRFR
jgi:Tfp pilus assembly protein PilZ